MKDKHCLGMQDQRHMLYNGGVPFHHQMLESGITTLALYYTINPDASVDQTFSGTLEWKCKVAWPCSAVRLPF
jgi:hypothetical protein